MSAREELMAWGQMMVPCDCDDAYKSRGMEAPDCLWHQGAGPVLDELLDSGWLRKVRAEAWDEGDDAGWDDENFNQRGSSGDADAAEFPHSNPHREVEA